MSITLNGKLPIWHICQVDKVSPQGKNLFKFIYKQLSHSNKLKALNKDNLIIFGWLLRFIYFGTAYFDARPAIVQRLRKAEEPIVATAKTRLG